MRSRKGRTYLFGIPGEQVRPRAHRRDAEPLRAHCEELGHGLLRVLFHGFEELEGVVRVPAWQRGEFDACELEIRARAFVTCR